VCSIGGIILIVKTRSTRRKTCSSETLSAKILHELTWNRTRSLASRDRRLTAIFSFSILYWRYDFVLYGTCCYVVFRSGFSWSSRSRIFHSHLCLLVIYPALRGRVVYVGPSWPLWHSGRQRLIPVHKTVLYLLSHETALKVKERAELCLRTQFLPCSKHVISQLQNQQLNTVEGRDRCVFWKPHKTHQHALRAEHINSECDDQ
jgi:hypothetical protein